MTRTLELALALALGTLINTTMGKEKASTRAGGASSSTTSLAPTVRRAPHDETAARARTSRSSSAAAEDVIFSTENPKRGVHHLNLPVVRKKSQASASDPFLTHETRKLMKPPQIFTCDAGAIMASSARREQLTACFRMRVHALRNSSSGTAGIARDTRLPAPAATCLSACLGR